MKQLFLMSAYFLLVLQIAAEPVEMLKNGGFELIEAGKPVGWKVNNAGILRSVSDAHHGKAAAEFSYVEHPWGYCMIYTDRNAVNVKVPGQPVVNNGTYQFSVWAKGKGQVQFIFVLLERDGWKFIRSVTSPAFKLSDKYQPITYTFKVNEPRIAVLQTGISVWKDSRIVLDDISMVFDPEANPGILDPGFVLPKKVDGKLNVGVFTLPFMKKSPCIDGHVTPEEYGNTIRIERLFPQGVPLLLPVENHYYVGSDGKKLYFAMVSEVSKDGLVDQKSKNARNYLDSVELLVAPDMSPNSKSPIFQTIMDFNMQIFSQSYHWREGKTSRWHTGKWEIKSSICKGFWHFEAAVPLAELKMDCETLKKGIGIRFCRNWSNLSSGILQSQINSDNSNFENPKTMPLFRWAESIPTVQHISLHNKKNQPALILKLVNFSSQKKNIRYHLRLQPQYSQPSEERKEICLGVNEVRNIELDSVADGNELTYGMIDITGDDSRKLYFRDFYFQVQQNRAPFILKDENSVLFDYGYYPSANAIDAEIDFSNTTPTGDIQKVKFLSLKLFRLSDGKLIASTRVPIVKRGFARLDKWKIPELEAGTYKLTAQFPSTRIMQAEGTFIKQSFIWENNTIGMKDTLLPGFSPIRLKNNIFETVLRKHKFNKLGLFDSILSQGREFLATPMRIEYITPDGHSGVLTGEKLQWDTVTDTRIVGNGIYKLNTERGKYSVVCDYDGMTTWEFFLPETEISNLKLIIPIKNKMAPLMHSVTDGLRHHFGGAIPKGDGVVWRGSKTYRRDFPAPFVPYLWVGAEERGLSVSATNEKGWSIAKNAESQELIRKGDTLELVYHLISAPVKATPGRSIKLSFLATPVKERPRDWRLRTFGVHELSGKKHNMPLLGQCRYWGAELSCADVFPRDRDMSILWKFKEARDTGKIDYKFFEKWLAGYTKMYATASNPIELEKMKKTYRNDLLNYPLPMLASLRPQNIVFYSNPRGIRFDIPEGQVFLNEWSRLRFPKRSFGYGDCDWYLQDPVKTYRDFSAYYFNEMSKIFLDVVYLDDVFLSPNYNLIQSDAFRGSDGTIHPDSGLYNMREHVRRCSMLIHEQNRPVNTMVHMTNTAIMPILSFSYTHFTWEYYADFKPFQERVTRESIRVMDTGLQSGTIPFGMILVAKGTPEEHAWAERTAIGVALSHDMKLYSYLPLYQKILKLMFAFGYGQEDAEVFNYWQEDYPVHIEGIDSSSLAVKKGKKLMLLICDWKNGGTVKISLSPKLGMMKPWNAVDMENSTPLKVENGYVVFPLKKYDFKLILLKEKE